MKHITPLKLQPDDPGYPTAGATDRRRFLLGLAGGLGAGAGLLLLGPPGAAREGNGARRVSLRFSRRQHLSGCDYVVDRVDGETRDARLATFLEDGKERPGLETVLFKVLGTVTCAEVTDRKRLSVLESRLARAALDHYRSRTRRTGGGLVLTLVLSQYRPPVPGGISAPVYPAPPPSRP
jgi:hypothetical protein